MRKLLIILVVLGILGCHSSNDPTAKSDSSEPEPEPTETDIYELHLMHNSYSANEGSLEYGILIVNDL